MSTVNIMSDIERAVYNHMTRSLYGAYPITAGVPEIRRVIFNDPATIILWADNTKTVVMTQDDDVFDPEKGMAMAIAKKALGNTGAYYKEFDKWIGEYYKDILANVDEVHEHKLELNLKFPNSLTDLAEAIKKIGGVKNETEN